MVAETMTYDEVAMERSKSFVNALQELKNLRPQLYSAADYCEKSYLNSEQKQMVLDNLKDYTVKALVNAVDHLGTVAFKLTDLLEQQTVDISNIDLKVMSLNQQLLTCQTYTHKEGLRQQQLLTMIPRHHKHYILPNSLNKKVHFSPHVRADPWQQVHARSRVFPSGTSPANTLSWHLASETQSTLKGSAHALMSPENPKVSAMTSTKFHQLDARDGILTKSPAHHQQFPNIRPASSAAIQTLGVSKQDNMEEVKLTPFRSFGNPSRQQIVKAPARSKSLFSSFFVKHKTIKAKNRAVS
ncbi:hypothetical protein Leryth_007198 [Lithospermum erythrorhizon]|nr:hypothetical protein Leryth_007198 [Lithospermum erythrorhizon]